MPTLSVVIPTKNEEAYLPRLLEAIDRQTKKPEMVVVADAGSTDQTVEIARSNGARVVEGGLPGVGRNRGAAEVATELIFFLDADAILLGDDFFEHAVDEFEQRGFDVATADVVCIGGQAFDRSAHFLYNIYVRLWGRLFPHAPGFCILVKRSLHEAIGGFDESVQFCEDHDYVGRANRVGVFGVLDDVRIGVPTRRQERDGRWRMAVTYTLAELHLLFLGPIRHDRFKYGFGHSQKK